MISERIVRFAEFDLQLVALVFMAVLYALKIFQLSRLPMPRENSPGKGSAAAGVLRTYAGIFLPWTMESSRNHPWRWLEFGAYHVGAGIAILNTFTTPFVPSVMTETVRFIFAGLIVPAVIAGLTKIYRRISRPEMRLISTPDDYFSLVSVEIYFLSAIIALLTNTPLWRTIYFFITAAFLFYVPFSKISHYIYFLFAGIITGGRYGRRGVRPQVENLQ